MNKAMIESIEWHKDQLFKLLEDGDLVKMEGSISSVKSDLNEIIEKAKSKKKVWVKATSTKKGHYREQEVGRKEETGEKEFSADAKKMIISGTKERLTEYVKDLANAKKRLEELKTWKGTGDKEIYRVQNETWTNALNSASKSIKESQALIERFSR